MSNVLTPEEGRKRAYVARNRAALLRATQEVLAEHGSGATIELVAAHAEVAVSTIYKHFPNKEALFEAALVGALLEWEDWSKALVSKVTDPLERLVFPMRYLVKVPITHPTFAKIVSRNPGAFVTTVPNVDFSLGRSAIDSQSLGLMNPDRIQKRVKNLTMVLTLTFVELCTNPEMTEEKALAGIAVALEMLGLSEQSISELMTAPLPEFSGTRSHSLKK